MNVYINKCNCILRKAYVSDGSLFVSDGRISEYSTPTPIPSLTQPHNKQTNNLKQTNNQLKTNCKQPNDIK